VFAGGLISHTVISNDGAVVFVSSGGLAISTIVMSTGVGANNGGLILQGDSGGGTAIKTLVNSGGQEAVFSGGTDRNGTIGNGGIEFVFTSGNAIGTTVRGTLDVGIIVSGAVSSAGGIVVNTLVKSPGVLNVFSGGIASNTTVTSGAKEIVFFSGVDIRTKISSGGAEIVSSGGTSIGATINKGGELIAANGGSADVSANSGGALFASGVNSLIDIVGVVNGGVALIGDGIVEIAGSSGENVRFLSNGSGGLELDRVGSAYKGKVSGFGDSGHSNHDQFIDFTAIGSGASVSYTSAASHTSGTLIVTSGGIGNGHLGRYLLGGKFQQQHGRRPRQDNRSGSRQRRRRSGCALHRLRSADDAGLFRKQHRAELRRDGGAVCRGPGAPWQLHGSELRHSAEPGRHVGLEHVSCPAAAASVDASGSRVTSERCLGTPRRQSAFSAGSPAGRQPHAAKLDGPRQTAPDTVPKGDSIARMHVEHRKRALPFQRVPDFHDVGTPPVNDNERKLWLMVASNDVDLAWGICMATSSKERLARYRARQKKGRHVISVEVDDANLREIAIAGYPEAVSTDRAAQGKAISLFLSDSINW
jgi:autotransporter passenger strand-loop-strand repeat protein